MSQNCIFCLIRDRQSPARIIYEDENVLAFEDINPQAPVHLLIIPKEHYPSLKEVPEKDKSILSQLLWVGQALAEKKGLIRSGYRLVINDGPDSGQQVAHLHVHLLGGRRFLWPPG